MGAAVADTLKDLMWLLDTWWTLQLHRPWIQSAMFAICLFLCRTNSHPGKRRNRGEDGSGIEASCELVDGKRSTRSTYSQRCILSRSCFGSVGKPGATRIRSDGFCRKMGIRTVFKVQRHPQTAPDECEDSHNRNELEVVYQIPYQVVWFRLKDLRSFPVHPVNLDI